MWDNIVSEKFCQCVLYKSEHMEVGILAHKYYWIPNSIILNNACTHVGATQEKRNCLVTQKCLLKLYSKKKKKASTEPDVSLRFGAKPVFPSSINSSSQENSKGAKIVQIFLFIHPSYIHWVYILSRFTESVPQLLSVSNVPSFHFHLSSSESQYFSPRLFQ